MTGDARMRTPARRRAVANRPALQRDRLPDRDLRHVPPGDARADLSLAAHAWLTRRPPAPARRPPRDQPAARRTGRPARRDDFGIAFLEMWAYIADILTFYQERIANEAFLRTAVQERSTTLLVSLIGYRPGPDGPRWRTSPSRRSATRPSACRAGLLVQSVPGQDEKPQKFETLADLTAHSSLNELRPRTLMEQTLPRGATQAVLVGHRSRHLPGDWLAVAGDVRRNDPGSERWDVRQVATVVEDEAAATTTVSWTEGLGAARRRGRAPVEPDPEPRVLGLPRPGLAVRLQRAGPATVRRRPRAGVEDVGRCLSPRRPDAPDASLPRLCPLRCRRGGLGGTRHLADRSARICRSSQRYDQYVELYPVLGAVDTAYANYLLSGRSTRVTLDAIGRPAAGGATGECTRQGEEPTEQA